MIERTAVIMHGMPDRAEYYDPEVPALSNAHWLPWLQRQLMIRDIITQVPEVPDSWRADYAAWCRAFERYDITPGTALVGHSCGGGFLVRWLSEHRDARAGRVVLVAPWLDPDREETSDFFDFAIDPGLAERTAGLTIFHSDDDLASIHKSVRMIRDAVPGVGTREFHGYGHFCMEDMKTAVFPELLQAVWV